MSVRNVETGALRPLVDLCFPFEEAGAAHESMEADRNAGKIILVIGHSNTLPALIGNMGASKKVPAIADDEYDNIYIVSIPWFGKTKTIRMRYGEPYIP